MSAAPTIEELAFWRDLVAQARLVAERPSQESAARLRRLGERAAKIPIPGYRRSLDHMRLFSHLIALARHYGEGDGARAVELAGLVDAAIEAAIAAPHAHRRDLA